MFELSVKVYFIWKKTSWMSNGSCKVLHSNNILVGRELTLMSHPLLLGRPDGLLYWDVPNPVEMISSDLLVLLGLIYIIIILIESHIKPCFCSIRWGRRSIARFLCWNLLIERLISGIVNGLFMQDHLLDHSINLGIPLLSPHVDGAYHLLDELELLME